MDLFLTNSSEALADISDLLPFPLVHPSSRSPLSFSSPHTARNSFENFSMKHPYSTAGRYTAIAWSLITALVALLGNAVVYIASVKYKALAVDRVSKVLIANLAVADCGCGLLTALTVAYMITERNVYGKELCYIFTRSFYFFLSVGSTFISALNLNKLHCLLFPLRVSSRNTRQGHLLCASVWLSIALVWIPLLTIRLVGEKIVFQPADSGYQCNSEASAGSPIVKILTVVVGVLFVFLPVLTILITAIWLGALVKRVTGGIQRQSVLTLIFISLVFFISYIPLFCLGYVKRNISEERQAHLPWLPLLLQVSTLLVNVNFAANPLIYFLTIRSFSVFVKVGVKSCLSCVPPRMLRVRQISVRLALYRVGRIIGWRREHEERRT